MTAPTDPRPAGRPYFDPAGAGHLADTLDEERRIARIRTHDGMTTRWADVATSRPNEHADQARAAIAELVGALRGVEGLFGPGVLAAITARRVPNGEYHHEPADRLEVILASVGRLAEQAGDAEEIAERNRIEVARLEHELASAQTAYDTTRRVYDLAAAQAAELTDSTTRLHAYTKTIEAALERVVGSGKANEVRRRARRHAKDVAARG